MPKGYVYAEIDILDPDEYDRYAVVAGATVRAHGGRYIALVDAPPVLEGEQPPHRVVLMEFPSVESARAWHASEDYRGPKSIRQRSAKTTMLLLAGEED